VFNLSCGLELVLKGIVRVLLEESTLLKSFKALVKVTPMFLFCI
jgi:hypothetical protein